VVKSWRMLASHSRTRSNHEGCWQVILEWHTKAIKDPENVDTIVYLRVASRWMGRHSFSFSTWYSKLFFSFLFFSFMVMSFRMIFINIDEVVENFSKIMKIEFGQRKKKWKLIIKALKWYRSHRAYQGTLLYKILYLLNLIIGSELYSNDLNLVISCSFLILYIILCIIYLFYIKMLFPILSHSQHIFWGLLNIFEF